MKLTIILISFFIFSCSQISAQLNKDVIDLQNNYELFRYSTVIQKAENLLLDKERFSDASLLKIISLKASSHYASSDQTSTVASDYV